MHQTPMNKKNALIAGGGIAGPVAAMALQRAEIEATVYEAHDAPADYAGLFLNIASNGLPLEKDANVQQFESAYLKEEGQGDQEGQANFEPTCVHGYPDGAGCYLCDPSHPYRPRRAERGKSEGVTQHGDTP